MANTRQSNRTSRERRQRRDTTGGKPLGAVLAARGDELLADQDSVQERLANLLTMSPKILGYSLRNQMLLLDQAAERGIELTDVDTRAGWARRGRWVHKGALYIVRPVGREDGADNDDEREPDESANPDEATEEAPIRFRAMPVWDISQTEPKDNVDEGESEPADDEPGTAQEGPTDPAALLWQNLVAQANRIGHAVALSDESSPVDNTPTISVSAPAGSADAVVALGTQLADVLTRTRSRNTSGQDRQDPDVIELALGDEFGTATVRMRTDWVTGRTYYDVTAPRAHGTWTVAPQPDDALAHRPDAVDIDHGEIEAGQWHGSYKYPPKSPVINGIRVYGGMHSLTPEDLDDDHPWHWHAHARRLLDSTTSILAPDATRRRSGAIAHALLRHWLNRPDLDQVKAAAARYEAPRIARNARRKSDKLQAEIDRLQAEQAEQLSQEGQYLQLASHPTADEET